MPGTFSRSATQTNIDVGWFLVPVNCSRRSYQTQFLMFENDLWRSNKVILFAWICLEGLIKQIYIRSEIVLGGLIRFFYVLLNSFIGNSVCISH